MINKVKEKWMNIPLTVKASASYAICSILQNCLSFITLPLFTRLLTTEQYGQLTIYSSWSGILSIFLTLNLAYGSFVTAMVKFDNNRHEYISSVQGINIILSVLFFLVYIPFYKIWNELFELPTFLVVLMVFEILSQNAIQLWIGKKRVEYNYKSVIIFTLLMSLLSPIVAYIMVVLSLEKGYARIFGYAFVTIVFGGIIFFINLKRGKHLFKKKFWKYAFKFNLPLLVYYLSQVIFNQSDRIMISHLSNKSHAAIYGVAYNLAMIMTFLLNAVNNSYVPWFYEKIKKDDTKENKNVSILISIIMSLAILCIIWFAPEIIKIMAGKKYFEAVYVVAPVAMSLLLLFYSQLFINVEFYYEEKNLLVCSSIGSAVLNIVLNYLFIPMFGYVVAGYTTLISYIVFAISNYFAMQNILRKRKLKDDLFNYYLLLVVLILFILSGLLGVFLYSYIILRILITCFVFVLLIIFRKKFIDELSMLSNKNSKEV